MGLFAEADRRTIAEEFAREAATPEPLSFREGVSAVMDDVGLTGRSDSLARQVQDSATRSLARLSDLTGEKFDFPTYGWSDRQSLAAVGLLNSRADAIKALRSDPNGPPDPFLKTGDEIQQEATQRVQQARAQSARAGLGAQIVGGIAGAATDPLNLALLPLGVARAETLAAKVVGEALVGAVAGGAMEVASLPAKDFAGVTPTAGEAAANIGLNAAFGAGIGALTHGVDLYARRRATVEAIDRGIADGTIPATRDITTARDAIQDHLDTVPPMATPEAEGAHLDAVAAATDVLRAEHPIEQAAALRRLDEKATVARQAVPEPVLAINHIEAMKADIAAAEAERSPVSIPVPKYRETLLAEIRRRGGLGPESIKDYAGTKIGESGLLTAARKGGRSLDQWHNTMIEEGFIPAGTSLNGFFDMISSKTKTMEAQDRIAGARFESRQGFESAWSDIRKMEEARTRLMEEFGTEPPLKLVEDYVANPAEFESYFASRWEGDAIEASVSREMQEPTPAYDPPSIDGPVTRYAPDPMASDADAYFRSLLESEPDIEVALDFDGVPAVGRAADIMADLDRQLAELGETTDCILGVVK